MSNPELGVPERAALLALMTFVSEVSNRDLRGRYGFTIDGKVRRRLEDLKLITSRRAAGVPGRPFVLELTEAGWRWGREELGAAAPDGAPRAYRLAYGLMNVLDRYIERSGGTMADVFAVDVEERIRDAYAGLADAPGAWVRLSRVRERLADLSRDEVDAALRRLDRRPGVLLDPEVNRKTLSDADRAAAVTIGGDDKHVLAIERS